MGYISFLFHPYCNFRRMFAIVEWRMRAVTVWYDDDDDDDA